jgi:hypothetical protein
MTIMQRNIKTYAPLFAGLLMLFTACKKDYGDLNGETIQELTTNASEAELNNLVSGTESGMRTSLNFYLDDVSIIGRETYRFSNSEPRYVIDLLGANGSTLNGSNFYITDPWAARYAVVKNCNILIQAATKFTPDHQSAKGRLYRFCANHQGLPAPDEFEPYL